MGALTAGEVLLKGDSNSLYKNVNYMLIDDSKFVVVRIIEY